MHVYPTAQGVNSGTWTVPPIDGTLTIPEIFDFQLKHSPTHPFFTYYDPSIDEVKEVSLSETTKGIHRAGWIALRSNSVVRPAQKVFAILGTSDPITYSLLTMGIIRSGNIAFPISPRNSPPMVAHLLKKTSAAYVFVTQDPATQALIADSLKDFPVDVVTILRFPEFDDIICENDEPVHLPGLSGIGMDSIALILHSSGSTAYPKPIPIKHQVLLEQGRLPWYGEVDLCGHVSALHSVPMFHSSGAVQLWWAATSGLCLSVLPPVKPPILPTPEVVFEAIVRTKSTMIYGVSFHIEAWAKDPSKVAHLKTLKAVIYQGAPLERQTGQDLISAGVSLFPVYGSTEAGALTCLIPDKPLGLDFDWFVFSPHYSPVFAPQDIPNVYELIMMQTDRHTLNVVNTTTEGRDAYATSDLLVQHPTRPQLWKVYGRADDQIALSSGEKVNPAPLEAALSKDPLITAAVMFGRARFHVGIIVQTSSPIDPNDQASLIKFRNGFWSTVEKVNSTAASHARIFKEMILIAKPSKPFEHTPKGTPRRLAVIAQYKDEIESAYTAVEESSQSDIAPPENWTKEKTHNFVSSLLRNVLKAEVGLDNDIFSYGCDSLQATWIRNSILHAIRKDRPSLAHDLSTDFVYKHPTIGSLSNFLVEQTSKASTTHPTPDEVVGGSRVSDMEAMLAELVANLGSINSFKDQSAQRLSGPKEETILLTGSTGSFGSHILAHVLSTPGVARVFAVNRRSDNWDLLTRQTSAFEERGLDVSLLQSERLLLLEGDLHEEKLGLSSKVYDEISKSVTLVMHNAWPVDFNYTLSSFKPALLGLTRLIALCLGSTATTTRFLFVSSVSVLKNHKGSPPAPEETVELRYASGLGYSESKAVAERLIDHVVETTSLPATIVRVDQLSGGPDGSWNTKEWFPAMVIASQSLGVLPQIDTSITWLPLHIAAQSLIEMRNCHDRHLHLTHPRPVRWETILDILSTKLNLGEVSFPKWITALKGQQDTVEFRQKTAIQLLPFYDSLATDPHGVLFDTAKARRASPTLADPSLAQISEIDVEKWILYLKKTGSIRV